ncbi:MAG: CRISPR-associated endonuclease Cas1 [Candidatus Korarchaeum sp.]
MQLTEYGHLIVDELGGSLRKRRGRILISTRSGKREIPIKSVRDVIVMGKVALTTDLLIALAESGVDLLIATPTGRPVARLSAARAGGTARNRYEQYESMRDRRGILIAKSIIVGKIRNQASNMRYYSKARRMDRDLSLMFYEAAERMKTEMEALDGMEFPEGSLDEARKTMLSVESRVADLYWSMMRFELGRWGFEGREKREASDPPNVCLNVAYNLLSSMVWKNVIRFGLDPFLGYVHVERPGRLSLVFDLMEPMRPMVDRFVVSFLRSYKGELRGGYSSEMIASLKERFFSDFAEDRVEYKGRNLRMESLIFFYVQEVVSALREGRAPTTPYIPW